MRASRWLERETQRNVDVMWLLKKLTPDHKTIADFRAVPPEAIKAVCREFTALCKALDLFGGERVAIEGRQFRAVNSRTRNFTPASLKKRLSEIKPRIDTYLGEWDQAAAEARTGPVPTAQELQRRLEPLRSQPRK